MKKAFLVISALCFSLCVFAEDALNECFKSYLKPQDDVYAASVAALNKNKFEILEMQTKSGYILFRAYSKDYLLTISPKSGGSSVKIVPANSNFSSGTVVQGAVFSTLDATLSNDPVKKVL